MRPVCDFCNTKLEDKLSKIIDHLKTCEAAPFHEIEDELEKSMAVQTHILKKLRED